MATLTVAAALSAACGDTTMAPEAAPRAEGLRPPYDAAKATGPNMLLWGDQTTSITIDPNTTQFYLVGSHWVYIPRGAVCHLGSSYGRTEWDKPCERETSRITVPVTVGTRNGHALIQFGKDMRFRPTSNPFEAVYLFLREPTLDVARYAVLYDAGNGIWINEALSDPTLRAFRVNGAWIGRRVKHFSGYNVALGFYEEQEDPTIFGF